MVGCQGDSESVPTSVPSLGRSSEELSGAAGQLTSVGLSLESNKRGTHWTQPVGQAACRSKDLGKGWKHWGQAHLLCGWMSSLKGLHLWESCFLCLHNGMAALRCLWQSVVVRTL